MKMTITLTEQEVEFLKNMQNLINKNKSEKEKPSSLEDIVHICLAQLILLGAKMQKGQA